MPEEQPTEPKEFDVYVVYKDDTPEKYVANVLGYSVENGCLNLSGQYDGAYWLDGIPLANLLEYRIEESS